MGKLIIGYLYIFSFVARPSVALPALLALLALRYYVMLVNLRLTNKKGYLHI